MGRSDPLLVIVGGAPAAGKTTLALRLSRELCLPLLTKDRFKELLGDLLPAADRDRSKQLGEVSYALLYAVAGWLLDAGTGLILEANFWRGLSEPGLRPLVQRSRARLIHCDAGPAETVRRYQQRAEAGIRHPVHFDTQQAPRLIDGLNSGLFEPLRLDIPVLRVDTSDGYSPAWETICSYAAGSAG